MRKLLDRLGFLLAWWGLLLLSSMATVWLWWEDHWMRWKYPVRERRNRRIAK